jgi:hypothetical protein
LAQSFYALRRDAAVGMDVMSWRDYEEGLLQRVTELHAILHKGAFRATPSRRVYIPKGDGRQRPLGIASLEDKIVQQAVVTVLNAIYEEDFLGFSYGFRPGRSQHEPVVLRVLFPATCTGKAHSERQWEGAHPWHSNGL